MGGAMKPSLETLWRMDHPTPSLPRPTWRERRKAKKQKAALAQEIALNIANAVQDELERRYLHGSQGKVQGW